MQGRNRVEVDVGLLLAAACEEDRGCRGLLHGGVEEGNWVGYIEGCAGIGCRFLPESGVMQSVPGLRRHRQKVLARGQLAEFISSSVVGGGFGLLEDSGAGIVAAGFEEEQDFG